jgi:hypothetical protein
MLPIPCFLIYSFIPIARIAMKVFLFVRFFYLIAAQQLFSANFMCLIYGYYCMLKTAVFIYWLVTLYPLMKGWISWKYSIISQVGTKEVIKL